jgi:ABC-2 type transport system permease protein
VTTLTGTRRLVRLALRRDRIVAPVWIGSLTVLISAIVGSVVALYATDAERLEAAALAAGNRIARVFDGPAAGTHPGSLGMVEAYGFMAILIGLFSAQLVVRHTRQDEETGRAELVGAGVVGRHARLAAALLVAFGANLVLGGLVTGALIVVNDLPVGGSVLAGGSFAGIGIAFAGVAAVTAQIAEQSRAANAWAGAAIGVAFIVRAIGDAAGRVADSGVEVISAWPSWLSPIGWGQQLRPYGDARPWLLVLFGVTGLVLAAVAFGLTDHRDVGSGMREVPAGPAEASPRLRSPLGLAWRQQRWVLAGWSFSLLVAGAAFGIVGEGADELVGTSEQFQEMLEQFGGGGALVDAYFAFLMRLIGIVAAGYTVQALLRLRTEEAAGRVEPLLATAVSRPRWMLSHAGIAVVGTVVVLALTRSVT